MLVDLQKWGMSQDCRFLWEKWTWCLGDCGFPHFETTPCVDQKRSYWTVRGNSYYIYICIYILLYIYIIIYNDYLIIYILYILYIYMGLSENGESQIHWLPIIFPSYVPSNGHAGGYSHYGVGSLQFYPPHDGWTCSLGLSTRNQFCVM